MYVVKRVRCFGCPADPFPHLECVNDLTEGRRWRTAFPRSTSRAITTSTMPLSSGRSRAGIETKNVRGWTWEELKFVDPVNGGSTRAEVDAFRLLAIFLGHWDNKPKNQRLLCQGEKRSEDDTAGPGDCDRPLAMIQDLGATFGPLKLDLVRWSRTRIWTDSASCKVSVRSMPYGGSTFPDVYISEEGRRFLADRLGRLSTAQIRALFNGARIARFPHRRVSGRNVDHWVRAFKARVRAIADHPPCPGDATPTVTQEWPVPRR